MSSVKARRRFTRFREYLRINLRGLLLLGNKNNTKTSNFNFQTLVSRDLKTEVKNESQTDVPGQSAPRSLGCRQHPQSEQSTGPFPQRLEVIFRRRRSTRRDSERRFSDVDLLHDLGQQRISRDLCLFGQKFKTPSDWQSQGEGTSRFLCLHFFGIKSS